MKVLLTGSTGFLGGQLAAAFLKEGFNLTLIVRKSSNLEILKNLSTDLNFHFVEEGINSLKEKFPCFDAIVHTATAYGNKGESSEEIFATNFDFPKQLLEAYPCPFINTDTFFCKSNEKYAYLNDYTQSKRQFFEFGQSFAISNKHTFINLRLEHLYGPNDGEKKFTISIVKQMMNNTLEIKLTPGLQVRDFVFIDDAVRAYLYILKAKNLLSANSYINFELGSGIESSIKEYVTIAHDLLKSKSVLKFGEIPYRENEIMFSLANIKPLEELGWNHRTELKDGIRKIINSLEKKSF